jgi:hypothetical protein
MVRDPVCLLVRMYWITKSRNNEGSQQRCPIITYTARSERTETGKLPDMFVLTNEQSTPKASRS